MNRKRVSFENFPMFSFRLTLGSRGSINVERSYELFLKEHVSFSLGGLLTLR